MWIRLVRCLPFFFSHCASARLWHIPFYFLSRPNPFATTHFFSSFFHWKRRREHTTDVTISYSLPIWFDNNGMATQKWWPNELNVLAIYLHKLDVFFFDRYLTSMPLISCESREEEWREAIVVSLGQNYSSKTPRCSGRAAGEMYVCRRRTENILLVEFK